MAILLTWGFKERPDSPASDVQIDPENQLGFLDSLRAVCRNKRLLIGLAISFGPMGCMWGFFGINVVFLKRCGISDKGTGYYGMGLNTCGTIIGTYLSRFTKKIGKRFFF